MSSFREEAAKMQAAYQEVQENQQEIDEGLGNLVRGGLRLLGRGGRAAARGAARGGRAAANATGRGLKSAASNKGVQKAVGATAAVGAADQYFTGGKGRRSLGRAARDLHNTAREAGHNLPEYGAKDDKKDKDKKDKETKTDDKKDTEFYYHQQ